MIHDTHEPLLPPCIERGIQGYGARNIKRQDIVELLQKWEASQAQSSQLPPSAQVSDDMGSSQSGRETARWDSKHAQARMFFLFVCPQLQTKAAHMYHTPERAQLDKSKDQDAKPWDVFWSAAIDLFNDANWQPSLPRLAHDGRFKGVDPNRAPIFTGGGVTVDTLKSHFTAFKTEFTRAFNNYEASGQNNPDNFENFVGGNVMLLYAFYVIERDLSKLAPLFTTELAEAISVDTSTPTKPEPGMTGAKPKRTKRQRPSEQKDSTASMTDEMILQEQHNLSKYNALLERVAMIAKNLQEAKVADDEEMVEFWSSERQEAMRQIKLLMMQ
jgi:hypothetical protein